MSLRQPHPGVLEWTLPTGPTSGRTYVVRSDPVTDGQLPELGMSLDNPQDEDGPLLYEQDLLDVVPPWMDIDEWLDQTTLSPSEIALALAN